jgi:hypothetical protein
VVMSEKKLSFPPKCGRIDSSGKKYFEVILDDGARARIDSLEGVTTQRSFVALGRALDDKLASCCFTAMNKLALFDENDGLSEEQMRKLFKTLGNPLYSAKAQWWASSTISCAMGG